MPNQISGHSRKVLIVSANPLFREGLRNMYSKRWGALVGVVEISATMEETLTALETAKPDLVIVDYDDKTINRAEFLGQFVTGESPMKVVLVSLDEAGQMVVYDRKHMTPSQAEDWLSNPWPEDFLPG